MAARSEQVEACDASMRDVMSKKFRLRPRLSHTFFASSLGNLRLLNAGHSCNFLFDDTRKGLQCLPKA